MKKILVIALIVSQASFYGQEHFAGLNTSSRVGILTAAMNPAELTNMSSQFEVNIIGSSITVSNSEISRFATGIGFRWGFL